MTFPFTLGFLLPALVFIAVYQRSQYFLNIFPLSAVQILSFRFFFPFPVFWISLKMFMYLSALPGWITMAPIILKVFLFSVKGKLAPGKYLFCLKKYWGQGSSGRYRSWNKLSQPWLKLIIISSRTWNYKQLNHILPLK